MPDHSAPTSICQWLQGLGLAQYEDAFVSNDVSLAILPSISADDLREIGVESVGHRRQILQAIEQLKLGTAVGSDAKPALPAPDASAPSPSPSSAPSGDPTPKSNKALPVTPPQASHHHRMLTVLFCDLVSSTQLSSQIDAEDLQALLMAYRVCVNEVIQKHKGFVAQYVGDGVLVYFGYPHILESDCERALRSALDIIRAVQNMAPVACIKLQVRLGVATGMVVIGQLVGAGATTEIGAVGETPNLAARMQALAQPDAVVVADGTRDAAGDMFAFRSLGTQILKGFNQPVAAWELLSQLHSLSRFHATRGRRRLGPLVGRDVELFFLRDRIACSQQGRGQAVLLRGEPGTGKSHLVARLYADTYPGQAQAPVLQCSPDFDQVPLYPFVQYLEAAAQWGSHDTDAQRLEKLQALTNYCGLDTDTDTPVLAQLLGLPSQVTDAAQSMNPKEMRHQVHDVLLRWLHSLMQERKLIVVEDLHWADPSSMEVFGKYISELPRLQAMLIATSRPSKDKILSDGAHVSVVHLDRLPQADIQTIVQTLAAPRELPPNLVSEIVLRAEGVPIFATELTRAILLRKDINASSVITSIPATLNDILLARLDQLEFGQLTIQQAAVLGREFEMSLLLACSNDLLEDSQAAIEELLKAELFIKRNTPNGVMLGFDHMLVRDAVYQRMLRADRTRLHAKVAQVMEQQFTQSIALSPHLVALHYSEAGNLERAAHFWEIAGELAASQLAPHEAVAHFSRALDAMAHISQSTERDEQELRICMAIAGPVIGTRGVGSRKLLKIVQRADELCNSLVHGAYHVPTRYLQWAVALGSWNLASLESLAHGVRDAAQRHGEQSPGQLAEGEVNRLLACRAMGFTFMIQGQLASAQDALESFLALYDAERHANSMNFRFSSNSHMGSVLLALATTCTLRKLPDAAEHWRDRALDHAYRSKNHLAICQALVFCASHVSGLQNRQGDMALYAGQAREYATQHKLPIWLPYADLMTALSHLLADTPPKTLGLGEAAATAHLAKAKTCVDILLSQHSAYLTTWVVLYARACLVHAQYEQGLEALAKITERIEAGERWMEPQYLHLHALLQNALHPLEPHLLKAHLQTALSLAQQQNAMIFVDDITLSLRSLSNT